MQNQCCPAGLLRLCLLLLALSAALPAAAIDRAEADRTLVLIGASYAKGWTVDRLAGMRVVNRGVGGEQSHEVLARFERDALAESPDAILIWGYINDIHNGSRDDIDSVLQRARANVEAMVAASRQHGIEPIVATELTVRGPDSWLDSIKYAAGSLIGKQSYRDYVNQQVAQLNDWLRGYAQREGVLLLDIQPVLSDERGIRQKAYAKKDGSHLTEAAYVQLTHFAEQELKQHLRW